MGRAALPRRPGRLPAAVCVRCLPGALAGVERCCSRPRLATRRRREVVAGMRNTIAADGVMAIHFLFIAFALLGSFVVLRWPRAIWLHLPALGWGAYIELTGQIC